MHSMNCLKLYININDNTLKTLHVIPSQSKDFHKISTFHF